MKRVSESSFTLTTKVWISQAKSAGIVSKQGNNGGTLAHRDIAIDFYCLAVPGKKV